MKKRSKKIPKLLTDTAIQALLLIAVFLGILFFQYTKSGFMGGHHGWLSSHGLTLMSSLSFEDDLLMYNSKTFLDDGLIEYDAYNRFPLFPFAILKITTLPFSGDFSAQIYMAHQVMNMFFIGAMALAFLSIKRIVKNGYQAIGITLLAFSSSYMLHYSDMVFNDTPALFGFMLAIFSAIYWEEGIIKSKSLLLLLSVLSVSMGWQAYAVHLTWFLINVFSVKRSRAKITSKLKEIVKAPYFVSLLVSILFGVLILSFQLLNEWRVVGGEFLKLPTVNSMGFRLGLGFSDITLPDPEWGDFLANNQTIYVQNIVKPFFGRGFWAALLILTPFLIGSAFRFNYKAYFKKLKLDYRYIVLFVASGILWHVVMKNFVFIHDFQAIFLVGIPISLYLCLSLIIPQDRMKLVAFAATFVFVLGVYQINFEKNQSSTEGTKTVREFENIYKQLPSGSKIYVEGDRFAMGGAQHATDYFLSGNYFTSLEQAEYILSEGNPGNAVQLTNNRDVNLFKVQK